MSDENPDELIRDKKYDHIFALLAAPFESGEVKTRTQAGRDMQYITARTVENRLDEVIGAGYWWDDYQPGENSVICRLTIELPDGRKITKADAGGYAGMPDSGDDDKSGFSDAIKRAAARFGVGRYLYRDGVPLYAQPMFGRSPEAVPAQPRQEPQRHQGEHRGARNERPQGEDRQRPSGPPKTGRALFAWLKEMQEVHQADFIDRMNHWAGKQGGFPQRIVDFDADQVAKAYAQACKHVDSLAAARN